MRHDHMSVSRGIVMVLPILACAVSGVHDASAQQRSAHDRDGIDPRSTSAVSATHAAELAAPSIVELTLTAAPARLPLLPGTTSDVYAYNGTVPGPTIELREGDRVVIRFRNELPEETTVHWHGLHLPVDADGSPFNPVAPGEAYEYEFTVRDGSAGTYWYHPHPHHRTAWQVGKGLYGALIVRPAHDPLAGLPEQLLVLADNRFLPDGTLDFPDPDSPLGRLDAVNGREGPVMFVNGEVMPTIRMRAGELQRWRIVNASSARVFRLSLPGHTFLHVGSDGGLFERPVERRELVIANSERVELLVRGTGAPGTRTVLETLPYDRYMTQTRPQDWAEGRALLRLQYTNEAPLPLVAVPATLRRVPALDTAQVSTTRVILMSQGRLNGRLLDMQRVDVHARLGDTEIWQIENLVGMDHPFHLHGFQFQVLDRGGVPEPYRSWKDAVNVRKRETVRFIVRFENHPGKWMFHCHILDHEDQGMMGVLEIR